MGPFDLLWLLLWLLLLGLLFCSLAAATLRDDSCGSGRGILGASDRRLLALRRRSSLPSGSGRLHARPLRGSSGHLTGGCRCRPRANDEVRTQNF